MKGILFSCVLIFVLISSSYANLLKQKMVTQVDLFEQIFEDKYAVKNLKNQLFGWDLQTEIHQLRLAIQNHPEITIHEYQRLLKSFFASTKDVHTDVWFHSTESSTLPFNVYQIQGKYFVSYIDSNVNTKIKVGDQLVRFGEQTVEDVVTELKLFSGGSSELTEQRRVEMALTRRSRSQSGSEVPKGEIILEFVSNQSGRHYQEKLNWETIPELIDYSIIERDFSGGFYSHFKTSTIFDSFFNKWQLYSDYDFIDSHLSIGSPFEMGTQKSFVPFLGEILWENEELFYAYIFENQWGHRIGYVRIPDYMGDANQIEFFGGLMWLFEDKTDALVIDQVNNPGGSVMYLYSLLSFLATSPLSVPLHRILLTQEDVMEAIQVVAALNAVSDEESAVQLLGPSFSGYPVDLDFAQQLSKYNKFLYKHWKEGIRFTSPSPLFGVQNIKPRAKVYSKPIVVLVNELDCSGGDFFPAVLKDNNRATLFGKRTAGAGGFLANVSFPNVLGVAGFSLTASQAIRSNGKFIENLGVHPDVEYDITIEDLQFGFKSYKDNLNELLRELIVNQ